MERCLICITEFKNKKSLGAHIGYYHNTKNYYDTYLKTNKLDGLCKICNKQTDFINLQKGYKQTCSIATGFKYIMIVNKNYNEFIF